MSAGVYVKVIGSCTSCFRTLKTPHGWPTFLSAEMAFVPYLSEVCNIEDPLLLGHRQTYQGRVVGTFQLSLLTKIRIEKQISSLHACFRSMHHHVYNGTDNLRMW